MEACMLGEEAHKVIQGVIEMSPKVKLKINVAVLHWAEHW